MAANVADTLANISYFVEVLEQARDSRVGKWVQADYPKATRWAHYVRDLAANAKSDSARQALEDGLREIAEKMCPKVELTRENLSRSEVLLTTSLLLNRATPDAILEMAWKDLIGMRPSTSGEPHGRELLRKEEERARELQSQVTAAGRLGDSFSRLRKDLEHGQMKIGQQVLQSLDDQTFFHAQKKTCARLMCTELITRFEEAADVTTFVQERLCSYSRDRACLETLAWMLCEALVAGEAPGAGGEKERYDALKRTLLDHLLSADVRTSLWGLPPGLLATLSSLCFPFFSAYASHLVLETRRALSQSSERKHMLARMAVRWELLLYTSQHVSEAVRRILDELMKHLPSGKRALVEGQILSRTTRRRVDEPG